MSQRIVTVWNATASPVKATLAKLLIKPAEFMRLTDDGTIDGLISDGSLVLMSEENPEEIIAEETTRKKRKEVAKEDISPVSEPEIVVETTEQTYTEPTEPTEDSILPEETV